MAGQNDSINNKKKVAKKTPTKTKKRKRATAPARNLAKVRGRVPILTKELIEELEQIISEGNTYKTAGAFVGLPESSLHRCKTEGKALHEAGMSKNKLNSNDKLYLEFYERITRARAKATRKHNAAIANFSATDWRASAWWLERNLPDEYGPKARLDVAQDVNINQSGSFEIKHVIDSEEKAKNILGLLKELLPDENIIDVESLETVEPKNGQ